MQQTNTYKLNLIETTDNFSPQPINENMEKVEAALLGQTEAMDVLSSGLLNCVTGTYTGNGKVGESNPNTLTFPFEPKFVLIMSDAQFCLFAQGASKGLGRSNSVIKADRYIQTATWNGNTMSWYASGINSNDSSYTPNSTHQMNADGTAYSYLAIG